MADLNRNTNGPSINSIESFDLNQLPDHDCDFISVKDLNAFAAALRTPDTTSSPSGEDLSGRISNECEGQQSVVSVSKTQIKEASKFKKAPFFSAKRDWAPVRPVKSGSRWKKKTAGKKRKPLPYSSDETREGNAHKLLKWPLLALVSVLMSILAVCYLSTRLYIWLYEYFVAWRGQRQILRRKLRSTNCYADWIEAAKKLDSYLGNDQWKVKDAYAYYDHKTVKRVLEQMRRCCHRIDGVDTKNGVDTKPETAVEELKSLIGACVKNNFVGVENSRLYSETYYGSKNLVQDFIEEVERGISILANTHYLDVQEKRHLFKSLQRNYGRTALCLSGGASFSYYHLGVVKALLDADLLPGLITGTSGGALIAALVATRTNDELKSVLVPTLANKINGCSEPLSVWFPRWWKTGARFDPIDWAKKCSWFTRGSMTFREAYERTGRILNITCVPSDPHSPTILTNYLTSPDCVIWSAVLASAAIPGILNPVVLMMKDKEGKLVPFSFGHKWKDGSLRTDIPLKALNIHFNVNFSIVSQVNPHINLFFFSSRGTVGQPVTHRKGRGWRGGFLGSAIEQYLKLDLNKWLRVVRALELLPRPLGQDWSQIWLQEFSGTVTIWPRTITSDFWHILSDPSPKELARMLHVGQQSAFPKLKFIANRLRVERMIVRGRQATRTLFSKGSLESMVSRDDMRNILRMSEGPGTEDDCTDPGGMTAWDEEDEDHDQLLAEIGGVGRTLINGVNG
ncbi:Patatin-like phospholipase domain-containing protein [Erysiphe neolycopersici]|uniref:Patatin-like phospholipase domain-containing protein n=1 Tax=Erysiphe neolycopersici TaxID=212602 RepID=A0A420HIE7_9PEZI|nr:Patatin-like phospholipase domain-containing protein [Erysiphe neolycopersici]